jgi:hypothetical protein
VSARNAIGELVSRAGRPEKVSIALVRKSAFDQPQYRPPLYWWRLGWIFVGQHSKERPPYAPALSVDTAWRRSLAAATMGISCIASDASATLRTSPWLAGDRMQFDPGVGDVRRLLNTPRQDCSVY